MDPEEHIDLGAPVPSPEAQELLMTSPEAREERRAIQLGRLAIYFGITERGRRRPGGPEQGAFPLYDSLSEVESANLRRAYYLNHDRHGLPLFDQFTRGYHVDPTEDSIRFYVSGSRRQAAEQAQLLAEAQGTPRFSVLRNERQRQTQHRADLLCRETHTNTYTAKIRAGSLKTTLALIRAGQPLDNTAALFAADALNDFGYGIAANKEMLTRLGDLNFGYKVSAIGERAVQNPEILRLNTQLMELALMEQRRRYDYWVERSSAALMVLGERRLAKGIKEAQLAVDQEIDRQRIIRQNIVNAQTSE